MIRLRKAGLVLILQTGIGLLPNIFDAVCILSFWFNSPGAAFGGALLAPLHPEEGVFFKMCGKHIHFPKTNEQK